MLFTLVKNELIKITRRSKTWIVFGMFFVLVAGAIYLNYSEEKNIKYYNSPEAQIENIQNQIEYLNNRSKELEGKTEEWAESERIGNKNQLENLNKELAEQQELLKHKDEPDFWKLSLTKEKERLQENIDIAMQDEEHVTSLKEQIAEIDKALEENKRPIEGWEFNAINFGISLFKLIGLIILASGIAVFMSDIVSGESTPPTLKFLLVQPIKRGKVILSKFIAVVLTVVTMIGGLEIIAFGIVGLIKGFNGWDMKEIIGIKYEWDYSTVATQGSPTLKAIENSGIGTTRWNLLLQSFGLQILFIIACCAFIFLISSIFKSSMTTMALAVIISVASTMGCIVSRSIGKIAHLIFFNYGDVVNVVGGNIAQNYNNPNFSLGLGISIMCITIIVSYIIAHVVFNKKDILI
ncbi:ABC transporter permease subunit [uncultured Clostridium sp.]|uniref:ABC transporter permease subunit n=1 Tax=uncultured Clostridium sp. TaxID=59620 RepID=UPI0025EB18ED|nr:ABC transporter permease subunit [uncultured Clostridium sp.]